MSTESKKAVTALLSQGVYVIGVHTGEKENLMTVVWVSQVSSQPPMLTIAVGKKHLTAELLQESDGFALSILAPTQKDIAERCGFTSGRKTDKCKIVKIARSPQGYPLVGGASGWMECRLEKYEECGDHLVFFGEIMDGAVVSFQTMQYHANDFFKK